MFARTAATSGVSSTSASRPTAISASPCSQEWEGRDSAAQVSEEEIKEWAIRAQTADSVVPGSNIGSTYVSELRTASYCVKDGSFFQPCAFGYEEYTHLWLLKML
jgi:hypothetical protein